MSDSHSTSRPVPVVRTEPALPYAKPELERFGTFRELTLAGGGGNCDPSLVLGPETGNPATDLGRCYE